MSDEEDRGELRRALAGDPSRRRQVELTRLAGALGRLLWVTRKWGGLTTDPIHLTPIRVGTVLYIQRLVRESPLLLTGSTILPLSTVNPARTLGPYNAIDRALEGVQEHPLVGRLEPEP